MLNGAARPDLARVLIGASASLREIRAMAPTLARSDGTVFIVGERGTGKEVIARAIHAARERPGPFVEVDCGAIAEKLAESELFGHVRGAFTDAVADHVGALERADGGVLFLDEIGNLPLELQVKLLRVLETRRVCRLGTTETRPVRFQLIVATNRDLHAAAAASLFHADLLDRIDVHAIEIPPLRERREDIGPIFEHLLATACAAASHAIPVLPPDVRAWAETQPWPANARGIRNLVERLLVRLDGRDAVTMDLVRDSLRPTGRIGVARAGLPPALPVPPAGYVLPPDWKPRMKDSPRKREILEEALAKLGSKTAAARALRMSWRGYASALQRLRDGHETSV